jgi:plastocyanin
MNRPLVASLASLAFLGLALTASPAPAAGKEYKVVEVKDGGKIHGFVKLDVAPGTDLALPKLKIFKDNDKGCGADSRDTERLLYDKETLGVANAIVYLKEVAAGIDWPESMRSDDRTATIDQKGCTYAPHAQWVRGGTQMVILNNDGADHNIHGFRTPADENSLKDTKFNFASAPGSKKDDVDAAILTDAGLYLVKCDIHPWMSAYVFVASNPYCRVTSAKADGDRKPGEFVLENVPPGDYTLVVWKEGMIEKAMAAGGKISAYSYSSNIVSEQAVKVEAGKEVVVPDVKIAVQK